jgi:hypothetical protein
MIHIKPQRAEGKYGVYCNDVCLMSFTNNKYIQSLRYINNQIDTPPVFYLNIKLLFESRNLPFDKLIFKQMMEDCIQSQINPIVESVNIPIPTTDKTLEELLDYFPSYRKRDIEILMSFITQTKDNDCPAWLMLISPPSSGKSFALELFNHILLSIMVDDFTANALAPGRPNKDAAEVDSLFQKAAGLNFIISDLSSIACMSKDKVNSFMGSITAAYGLRYRKMSPGGMIDIETGFNLIMGVTPKTYKQHKSLMDTLGPRMLFMWYTPDPKGTTGFTKKIEREDLQKHMSAFCLAKLQESFDLEIDDDINKYIKEQVELIVMIRNIRWCSEWREMEGTTRLEKQIKTLAIAHAKLMNRKKILLDDIDLFLPLAYETIPYTNNILEVDRGLSLTCNNKYSKIVLQNAIKFNMVYEHEVIMKKQHGFDKQEVEQILYMWNPEYANILFYLRNHIQNVVDPEEYEQSQMESIQHDPDYCPIIEEENEE